LGTNREPLIEELTDLRLQLDETEMASAEFAAIKAVITKIRDLDKKHMEVMTQLHNGAKASYKDVKQGQRMTAGYNPLAGNESPSRFDIKQ